MNKNTIIAIVLIAGIIIGFSWYNNSKYTKQQEEIAKAEREQFVKDSIALANLPKSVTPTPDQLVADSTLANTGDSTMVAVTPIARLSQLELAMFGKEEQRVLENEKYKITFSNKGGRIASVELKEYKKYGGDPLILFNGDTSDFGISLYIPDLIKTSDYFFEPVTVTDLGITYRLKADSINYIDFNYALRADDYMMDMSIDLSNFKGRLAQNQPDIKLDWSIVSPQQEKGFKNENMYTTLSYKVKGDDEVDDIGTSEETKSKDITTKLEWAAFKQQFFSSVIINKEGFSSSQLKYETFAPTDKNIKHFYASLTMPYSAATQKYDFSFYLGPNKFSTLSQYEGLEMAKLVPLGWSIFRWVNRWIVIPTFDFLGKYIGNFGLVILLLTLFIKLLILPLTFKSYMSMAKMRLLKPEIDEINQKYPKKDDAMKKQQATMNLYKKAGVSPMGGCLPMLIQMPILFAMFRFFPSAIELRQKAFLWVDDLSSYDSIWDFPGGFSLPMYGDHISLFTLLMALAMYVNGRLTQNQQPSTGQMGSMKFMTLYLMPIMMLLWFNNYSAGLSWYYFLSTLITIIQTYLFRFAVSDDKIHAKMKENAKKPVKKSKWAERIEEMQRQQATAQKGNKK